MGNVSHQNERKNIMPKADKVVNYSPEMVVEMETVYTSAKSDIDRAVAVKALSEKFGKTVNSIRAKLSKMSVYIKPAPTNKAGVTAIRKNALVDIIAAVTGKDAELMGSLEKATKFALESVIGQFDLYESIILDLEASQDITDEQ